MTMCLFTNIKYEIYASCEKHIALANEIQLFKLKEYGFQIVYHRENYIVLQKKNHRETITWNYLQFYKQGNDRYHTHLNSLNVAKTLVDNIVTQKKPKSRDLWILRSHARVADENYVHKNWVLDLIEVKRSKNKECTRKR